MSLTPDRASFFLLSFEGPDRYSQAGGLGVRISHLADTLASKGFETHLLFIGDPSAPGEEVRMDGRLIYHRWCQWISRYYPLGVYQGEEEKLNDFNRSVPPFLLDFVRSTLANGKIPVILAEEWHTAEALNALGERLRAFGLDGRVLVFWNANNTMSFHRVDWERLSAVSQITTVSRYMKHLMWKDGVNPIVIPNGIPANLLEPVSEEHVKALRRILDPTGDSVMLFKVGRFDPAIWWIMAVEAAARLKARDVPVVFPLVGGIEPHGAEVLGRAAELGLSIRDVDGSPQTFDEVLGLLESVSPADVYNLRFFLTQDMLRPFYRAADAVLANSGHEPFGLVGLEAMAAGGIVYTGVTGEDYASVGSCAVALDTDSPDEIMTNVLSMRARSVRRENMRHAARSQAAEFTWPSVADILIDKVTFTAHRRGLIGSARDGDVRHVRDVVIYTVVHQPRRLRLPARPIPSDAGAGEIADAIFDEEMNRKYFLEASLSCYYPALDRFQRMIDRGFKLAIGFSLSFVDQARAWDPGLLDRFRALVQHENVELVSVAPTHSFSLLWDIRRFTDRMKRSIARLQDVFGVVPVIADTSDLMMSDTIYHALDGVGFTAALADGRNWTMSWREPTQLYHHNGGRMKILMRHFRLSEDVGFRFTDRTWPEWPLTADRYASWLAGSLGDAVVVGWDIETFGLRHSEESGIFDFLESLPDEVHRAGLRFALPREAVERHGSGSRDLPLPEFASTWAGSEGLEFFLGNQAQRAVFHLMMQAHQKALVTGRQDLIDLSLGLGQSDNLHVVQSLVRSGSDVPPNMLPQEWREWSSGLIVREIQQVYRNFIHALDVQLEKSESVQRIHLTKSWLGRRRKRQTPSIAPPLAKTG